MEILSVENLNFKYAGDKSETLTLKHINFRVNRGEFILFCGSCGCGKTTLLKLLKEEIAPAGEKSGSINIFDKTEKIGYLFQNPDSQIVCQTVEEELVFGAENLGMDRFEMARAVAELTAYLGIEKILHAKTEELSGGQKQMLNLASLLMMRPKILILDEPVSQLDPVCTWEFMNLLKKVREDFGLTILVAEHNLDVFLQEVDRVIYMEKGEIKLQCEKEEFIKNILAEGNSYYESLPETVKLYHTLGGGEDYVFTPARLMHKLNKQQLLAICESEKKENTTEKKEEILNIKGGYFRYEKNGRDVLCNLSLSLEKNKIYGMIGGNGGGKSTLFSVLSGYRKLYRGKIKVKGTVGILPQNPVYAFFMDTLKEDYQMIADEKEIETLLNKYTFFSEVSQWLSKNPLDLSGGQMQKAAIFKMLLKNPDILLLDEPVKAMDGYEKHLFAKMLEELKTSGKTILFISHDLEFVQRCAEETLFLFDGKISSKEQGEDMFVNNRFYTTVKGKIRGMLKEDE